MSQIITLSTEVSASQENKGFGGDFLQSTESNEHSFSDLIDKHKNNSIDGNNLQSEAKESNAAEDLPNQNKQQVSEDVNSTTKETTKEEVKASSESKSNQEISVITGDEEKDKELITESSSKVGSKPQQIIDLVTESKTLLSEKSDLAEQLNKAKNQILLDSEGKNKIDVFKEVKTESAKDLIADKIANAAEKEVNKTPNVEPNELKATAKAGDKVEKVLLSEQNQNTQAITNKIVSNGKESTVLSKLSEQANKSELVQPVSRQVSLERELTRENKPVVDVNNETKFDGDKPKGEVKVKVAASTKVTAEQTLKDLANLSSSKTSIDRVTQEADSQLGISGKSKIQIESSESVMGRNKSIKVNSTIENTVDPNSIKPVNPENIPTPSTQSNSEVSENLFNSQRGNAGNQTASAGQANKLRFAQPLTDVKEGVRNINSNEEQNLVDSEGKLSNLPDVRKKELLNQTNEQVLAPTQKAATVATVPSISSATSFTNAENIRASVLQEHLVDVVNTQIAKEQNQAQKIASPGPIEVISINRKDFSNAVKEKVMVMVNQKLQQIDIRLDPPELGNMQVRVNLQNEQAAVSFVVQNQQAKEELEQNLPKLREMLSDSGVDVGDANVSQQEGSAEDFAEHANENASDLAEHNETISGDLDISLVKASPNGVDYYV